MEYREFTGKTVEDAKEAACKELGISVDSLNFEVMEEEKGGFLGLFKNAKIRVAIADENSEDIAKETEEAAEVTEAVAKGVKEAVDTSMAESGISLCYNAENPSDTAVEFIYQVLKQMELKADITAEVEEEEETIYIDIEGEDMGSLIGKRGQTLDALQYLTSLVVNRVCGKYYKIKLDTENYRARRKETLENLAKNIAMKVKKTHRSVSLEPMNPYERRIIHAALQNDKYVETHSEGEEPYRKVIVSMKKGVTYESGRYGRGGYGNNRYGNNRYGNGGNRYNNHGGRGGYRKNYDQKPNVDENGEKIVPDYMKDYAAYKEARAAEKAAEAAKTE